MKVLIVNNAAPFVRGGAEALAEHLTAALAATPGVESELLRLPFTWFPSERLIDEIFLHRTLRLHNVDRVIALKFPAYLTPHPNKILWILHQFRQAYDLGDAGQGLGDHGREAEIKAVVRAADEEAFNTSRRLYVNSPVTLDRLRRYNRHQAQVLYPPLNDPELFGQNGPGGGSISNYVFAGGRINLGKRQHLLIEAMAQLPWSSGKLLIAGPPDTPADADRLMALIKTHELEERVVLKLGFHPREQIAAWVNGALACACLPYDEDSLSYVAMEAFAAAKSVLTTSDSGGVLELVNETTGWVRSPNPDALAEGLSMVFENPGLAARLGSGAKAHWETRGLTWSATVETLLS